MFEKLPARRLRRIAGEALRGFQRHNAPRLGAALAFYTLLSLSPLLMIVLAVVGAIFGPDAARGEIARQIESQIGAQGAKAVEALISSANHPARGWIAALVAPVVLIAGATGVFVELKAALDTIWEVQPNAKESVLRIFVLDRILAFAVVCGMALVLLASLILSAILAALDRQLAELNDVFPARIANTGLSLALTAAMFAIIFKLLPSQRPSWRQVLLGSAITALLFEAGKLLIGIYLGRTAVGSAYGAAGSLVVLLVWVYYSTQIFLFGAEITRASSRSTVDTGASR